MVSYGNILKSDNHHFITHMLLHWLPLLYLATRQAGGLDISNVNQAEIQAATQPVWISHLPGLFSDAQIGLLITDFLLLFVTCCVVRAWGVCKIISVSSNEGPVRNCVSMMWLSNTLSNTLTLPELLIQTSGLDQDLLGIREINCWVSVNYETKTITVLLSTGAKENNKNNATSRSW